MKIKKLIIENINSLYGRFEINFEDKAFSDGIFAITGPTGSGKSTILDAVSLALFAETPRIKGGAETMLATVSHGAPSSLAELTFEVDGNEYMASFGFGSFLKGEKKGTVNPKSIHHTLSMNDKILTEKISDTPKKVTSVIGMNSEQFYRAALLAQGQFAAFLHAGKEKADILEQITGSEIYSKIGIIVHEKNKAAADDIKLKEAALSGIKLLDEETKGSKTAELAALHKTDYELKTEQQKLNKYNDTYIKIAEAEKNLEANTANCEKLAENIKNFAPDADKLTLGLKALNVAPAYKDFADADNSFRKNNLQLSSMLATLPELQKQFTEKTAAYEQSRKDDENTRTSFDSLSDTVKKVRILDGDIKQQSAVFDSVCADLKKNKDTISNTVKAINKKNQELAALAAQKSASEKYLELHSQDKSLPELKAQWLEQLHSLGEKLASYGTAEKNIALERKAAAQADDAVKKAEQKLVSVQKKTAESNKNLIQAETALQKILNGATVETLLNEQQLLQKVIIYHRTVINYENDRKNLADNSPCPLCGSLHHPYALGNVPALTDEESQLENLQKRINSCRKAEEEIKNLKDILAQAVIAEKNAENDVNTAKTTLANCENSLQKSELALAESSKDINNLTEKISQSFSSYNFEWDGRDLPADIDKRILKYQQSASELDNFDKTKSNLETVLDALKQNLSSAENESVSITQKYDSLSANINKLKNERFELFSTKSPDDEMKKAQQKLNDAASALNKTNAALSSAAETLNITNKNIAELRETIDTDEKNLKSLRSLFEAKCQEYGFSTESFLAARMDDTLLNTLTARKAQLEQQSVSLKNEADELAKNIAELKNSLPQELTFDTLQQQLASLNNELAECQQKIGGLSHELELDNKNRSDMTSAIEELEKCRKTAALWNDLNSIIGGTDGQRFRRIAQGITLDRLLVNANDILKNMNNRYELVQKYNEKDLNIDVIDHLQGDEIRSSDNLSGGESFQVSLALALGLSSMAGEKIRIDSLFLDEGFGTLDPDSLENALRTLANLHRTDGKIIGIISHVQTIADNVPSIIEVTPDGTGRSTLSGAGISA